MYGFERDNLAQARENLTQALRAFSLVRKSEHVCALMSRVEALRQRAFAALDPVEIVNELEALVQDSADLKPDPASGLIPDPTIIVVAELKNALRYASKTNAFGPGSRSQQS